jgi:hypothetical protein
MFKYGHGKQRCLLMVLLCLVVLTQSAEFTSANEIHGSQDHCCLLCHVGPLPFLNTTLLPSMTPVLAIIRLEFRQEFTALLEPALTAHSSRGPPA